MSPQDFGLTLALFPSPPSTVPPSPRNSNNTDSNKSMAPGSTTPAPSSSRPELALYYFNSPTMLPHQKKPIPLMPSNSSNVDVVMMAEDGKGPAAEPTPRKRERSPLPSDSEKGNKRKTPRKMRSSPFLAAATGHFLRSLSPSSLSAAVTAPATSPKAADGTTGFRNGDTARATLNVNASTSNNNHNNVNSAEMETVKVISRAVRQRVAQSSSSSTAASAIAGDTAAPVRSVEVECTSPTPIPPAPSSSSSKSPFKKRRRVEKTRRQSSPLRNPPLSASDFPIASSSRAPSSTPSTTSPTKDKKPVKVKPTAWEKRPLLQKVILKEFERTPHGAEILRRGAKSGIAFLEEQRRLLEATGRENQSPKSGRKSTSSDEVEVEGVKSRSKDVSSMRHWGRIVKTALAGPLKEMAGPMAGDGRPPMPMIRAW